MGQLRFEGVDVDALGQVVGMHAQREVVGDLLAELALERGEVGLPHDPARQVDGMDAPAEDGGGQAVDELFEPVLELPCQSHDPGLYGGSVIADRPGPGAGPFGRRAPSGLETGPWYHSTPFRGEWRNWQTRRIQVPVR